MTDITTVDAYGVLTEPATLTLQRVLPGPIERVWAYPKDHTMQLDPPRRVSFTWNGSGDVSFDLEPCGDDVLLTVTHCRVPNHSTLLSVSGGWHSHIDVLAARIAGNHPAPHWDNFVRLKQEYAQRMPE